jgi:hypothetical protein
MCFWFGLEILRIDYKKAFFKNIVRFLSYLTFYPPKKVALPLIRVKREKIFTEKRFFRHLENFAKVFFGEKNAGNFLMQDIYLHIFEISVKFRFF